MPYLIARSRPAQRFAYPGVRQLSLGIGDDDERVKLLKIKLAKQPRPHKGIEALVLRGAFRDGNRLASAANSLADQHIQHPRAEGDVTASAWLLMMAHCVSPIVLAVLHMTFFAKSLSSLCFLLLLPPMARTL